MEAETQRTAQRVADAISARCGDDFYVILEPDEIGDTKFVITHHGRRYTVEVAREEL
jgi:hypothetical protein